MFYTRKRNLFGIAVLLCTALVFLGCEALDIATVLSTTPDVPTGFRADAGAEQVVLTWTASQNAAVTGYKIRQIVDGSITPIDVAGRETVSYTVTGLTAGKPYRFTIAAMAGSIVGAASAEVTVTPTAAVTDEPTKKAAPAEKPAVVAAPAAPQPTATHADGQITISWDAVTGAASYTVYQGTNDNEVQNITEGSSAVITGLSNGTIYSFWVAAVNSGGSTLSAEITAAPQAALSAPAVPTELTAAAGASQVKLRWDAVSGATGYRVYQDGAVRSGDITVPRYTVRELTAGTAYTFTVRSFNSSGESEHSGSVEAVPLPAAPAGFTAGIEGGQVILTWAASEEVAVTGYTIRQTVDDTTTEIAVIGRETTSRTVTGLSGGKQYSFTITAAAGTVESGQSEAVTAVLLGAPVVTATPADGQITLSWDVVLGAGGYKIYQGTPENVIREQVYFLGEFLGYRDTESMEIIIQDSNSITNVVITGLSNGSEYSFWVTAIRGTDSVQSDEVKGTPAVPETIPAEAPVLTAGAGVDSVQLSWNAVSGAGEYKVYQDGNAVEATIRTPSYTVTGLTAGTSYSFTVSGVNSAGEGPQSASVTVTPLPPAVSGLAATAGIEQVVLTWTASTNAAVTGYTIRQTVDGTETEIDVTGMSTASHTVTGLTAGVAYSFTIAAVAGSTESTASSAVTATPAPPAVSGLAAAAGVAQVTLSWTASSNAGVTGYTIRQTVDGTETAIEVSGMAAASHTVTGLTAGKSHSFTITAVAGSTESTASSAVTATPAPPAVSGLAAAAGVQQVALSWTASSNAGVTGYKIRQTVDGTTTEIGVTGMSTASHTVTGLTAGAEHSFTIAAVAGTAESTTNSAVTATPTPPAVSGLAAAAGVAQVELAWTASSTAGVTGYTIRQTVDGTETEIDISGRETASHTVTGLANGKSYSFTIAAVAGTAESVQSTAVTATLLVLPVPQNVRAAVSEDADGTAGSRQQVVLSWDCRRWCSQLQGVSGQHGTGSNHNRCDPHGERLDRRAELPLHGECCFLV